MFLPTSILQCDSNICFENETRHVSDNTCCQFNSNNYRAEASETDLGKYSIASADNSKKCEQAAMY